jgi:hypothetical protein
MKAVEVCGLPAVYYVPPKAYQLPLEDGPSIYPKILVLTAKKRGSLPL